MNTWPKDQLSKIAEADDLHIAPLREDGVTYGTPTWIWSVAVDGALFVRAYNGPNSRWYRAAARQRAGRITAAGTDHALGANSDLETSAISSISFLGLFPPKARKPVSFSVSIHRGATQTGILVLVSIARATSRRIHHCRPWLSDVSQLRGCSLSVPCAARLWRASA
jgi:hypothetical protein